MVQFQGFMDFCILGKNLSNVRVKPDLSSIFLLLTVLLSESAMFGFLGAKSESQTLPILITDVLSAKKVEHRSGIALTFEYQRTVQSI